MIIEKLPCLPAIFAKLTLKKSTYNMIDGLPALSAQQENMLISPKHLAVFKKMCGYKQGNKIPATYLQSLAMPMILGILSDKQFPIRAIGKMHVGNKVTVVESFDPRQPVTLKVCIGSSLLTSRGLEWDIDFSAMVDNQLVWTGVSTYLYQCQTGISSRVKPKMIRGDEPQDWQVQKGIGRRYGYLTGDCNPMHLSSLTAKLFGFKNAIAHGMWTKSRCIAGLEDQLPESGYSVDVSFQRPVFIPSQVRFYTRQLETGQHFSLFDNLGQKSYLQGLIS